MGYLLLAMEHKQRKKVERTNKGGCGGSWFCVFEEKTKDIVEPFLMLTVVFFFFFYYLKNLVSIHVNMHRCVMDGVQMILLEWGGGGEGGAQREWGLDGWEECVWLCAVQLLHQG